MRDFLRRFLSSISLACESEKFFNLLLLNINWKIVVQVFSLLTLLPFQIPPNHVVNYLFNTIFCLTLKLDLLDDGDCCGTVPWVILQFKKFKFRER